MKKTYEGKNIAEKIVKAIINLTKWLYFALTVITIGFTLGLIVMYICKGKNISLTFISNIYSTLTNASSKEALAVIKETGIVTSVFVAIGNGLAFSIIFGIQYIIMDSVNIIYKSIHTGYMFTEENIRRINKLIVLSIILTFVPEIILFFVSSSAKVVDHNSGNFAGIVYFCIAYVSKQVFAYGYELEQKSHKAIKPAKEETKKKENSTSKIKKTTKNIKKK